MTSARDCDALLLAARHRVHRALFKALKVDKLQHTLYALRDLIFRHFFKPQSERDVVEYVQVRKQRVFLEHGVYAALVGRNVCNVLALKKHLTLVGVLETADYAQHGGLAAARRAEQRNELALAYIQVYIVQRLCIAELLGDAHKVNKMRILNHTEALQYVFSVLSQNVGGVLTHSTRATLLPAFSI